MKRGKMQLLNNLCSRASEITFIRMAATLTTYREKKIEHTRQKFVIVILSICVQKKKI